MHCNSLEAQQNFLCLMAALGSTAELRVASTPTPCPRLSKYLILLDDVRFDGVIFELKKPLQLTLFEENGMWNCESEEFGIVSAGETSLGSVHSFCEDFSVLWEEIAQAPDSTLTTEAQRVKRVLLFAVKSVEVG